MGSEMMFPKDDVEVDALQRPMAGGFFSDEGRGRAFALRLRRARHMTTPTAMQMRTRRPPRTETTMMAVGRVSFPPSSLSSPCCSSEVGVLLLLLVDEVLAEEVEGIKEGEGIEEGTLELLGPSRPGTSRGRSDWSSSMVHSPWLSQENPKGQHVSPQRGRSELSAVVLRIPLGLRWGSLRLTSQEMGLILVQPPSSGPQQTTVEPPARLIHVLPSGQQSPSSRPSPHWESLASRGPPHASFRWK